MELPPHTSMFSNQEWRGASNDAIVIYLTMWHDAVLSQSITTRMARDRKELMCGLDVHSIAQLVGLPVLTVSRVFNELSKRKWIGQVKDGYLLGWIRDREYEWMKDTVSNPEIIKTEITGEKPSDIVRKKIEEDRKRFESKRELTDTTKAKIAREVLGGKFTSTVKSKDILSTFAALFYEKYEIKVPLIEEREGGNPHAMTYVYIGRAIKWSKSAEQVLEVVRFMFKHWDEIKAGLGLDGRPSFNMLGSSKLWPRLVCCMTDEIPKPRRKKDAADITHRFTDKTVEKGIGW